MRECLEEIFDDLHRSIMAAEKEVSLRKAKLDKVRAKAREKIHKVDKLHFVASRQLDNLREIAEELARLIAENTAPTSESLESDTVVFPDLKLLDLDLSERSKNSLSRGGYVTLSLIANATVSDLLAIRGLGKKSVTEIKGMLNRYDLVMKSDQKNQ